MFRRLIFLERVLITAGATMIALYALAKLQGTVISHLEIEELREESHLIPPPAVQEQERVALPQTIDHALWSTDRLRGYRNGLLKHYARPVALLRIPRLNLEVPVLDGIDETTLNVGAGLIPATARPGQSGNIAIAGHRDGFFRGLKDIQTGDIIELRAKEISDIYVVDHLAITNPGDIAVLRQQPTRSITLITCYPFYYVGSAPQRYVVQGTWVHKRQPPGVSR